MENPITRMEARTRSLLAAYLLSPPTGAAEVRLGELVQTGGESGTFGRLHLTLVQVLAGSARARLPIAQLAQDAELMWRLVLERAGRDAPLLAS
jgi:hypothetical protein